ncbi:MAG: hypothetical protein LC800_03120 [Acidobacteria bacterium]|nr:hypothetical protein [Acidobacteriota bacterium]
MTIPPALLEPDARARVAPAPAPQPLAPARWDWAGVRSVLFVRLRSIGDAVLATPALHALRRFLPDARIDLLLEDWVAPLLENSADVTRVIRVARGSKRSRLSVARELRTARYDVAFNLHGGSTASLVTWATGARHRVGFAAYSFARLHNHAAPPSAELWRSAHTHSAEQQLALLGWTGVPVSDRPRSRLVVAEDAARSVARKLEGAGVETRPRRSSARRCPARRAPATPARSSASRNASSASPSSASRRPSGACWRRAARGGAGIE